MKLRIFQIDAFTGEIFHGNPAGVCPLDSWLAEPMLLAIAAEMNLSETCFFVGGNGRYEIRWFTPLTEIDLCGHATLAAAWVLVNELGETADPIRFSSRSGELPVRRKGAPSTFTLDFPAQPAKPCEVPDNLLLALGELRPLEVLGAEDYLVVLENETEVRTFAPDIARLSGLPKRGVIVTARGDAVDFVSRWFGPNVGVDEDPVTGSAHTTLAPYWAERLDKRCLKARQISKRVGELECELAGSRVFISGSAVKFLDGEIEIR